MDNPATVLKLQYPISWGKGEVVTELEFRRIKARDLRKLPEDGGASTVMLISRVTGQPPSVIDELDGADLIAAGKIIEDFLPKSPETGGESSDGLPIE